MIKTADYIIDMGPEGGDGGGTVIAQGTPEEVAEVPESYTGYYVKKYGKIVNLMKSYTTYHIWKRYPQYLRKQFWKAHTFWTDGYLACSVGNVSEEMLKRYIENQG